VSKRHNTSRRRTYGRRLHEVHERHDRRPERDRSELDLGSGHDDSQMDPIAFLDSRTARTRYGFAD
jgi:hypothetical protein